MCQRQGRLTKVMKLAWNRAETLLPVPLSCYLRDAAAAVFVLLFWLVLLTIIFHEPLPERLTPTLFILIAPPVAGFISYEALTGQYDPFARVLYYAALFLTLLQFTQWRRFARLRFSRWPAARSASRMGEAPADAPGAMALSAAGRPRGVRGNASG